MTAERRRSSSSVGGSCSDRSSTAAGRRYRRSGLRRWTTPERTRGSSGTGYRPGDTEELGDRRIEAAAADSNRSAEDLRR